MKCISCGAIINNPNFPCPNCGYKFDFDDSVYCPNSSFGKCLITKTMCPYGTRFNTCPTKAEIDREYF